MFRDSKFWETEKDSVLLARNNGFVTKDNAPEICSRVEGWLKLIPEDLNTKYTNDLEEIKKSKTDTTEPSGQSVFEPSAEMARIFEQDAIRTFSTEEYRAKEVEALRLTHEVIKDYHQGLGFITAFLLLFLEKEDVAKLVFYLNDGALNGYFKLHNRAYLRDCRVYDQLLEKQDPKLSKHLQDFTVSGQYLSKWFIGMGLHVFPFQVILDWYELVLNHGHIALFNLALGIAQLNQKTLLNTKSPHELTLFFKFDVSKYPDSTEVSEELEIPEGEEKETGPGSFFRQLIRHTKYRLDKDEIKEKEINELRIAVDRELDEEDERRKKWEAEHQYSDEDEDFSDSDDDSDGDSDDSNDSGGDDAKKGDAKSDGKAGEAHADDGKGEDAKKVDE